MPVASLYDRPDLYDLVAVHDSEMERFYVDVGRSAGGPVLDLACGTGRLTIPMADANPRVVGGDLCAPMLERGREAASERGLAVEFIELDMRNFDLGRQFAAVTIAANSILHLKTADDFSGFFECVRRHLAPGGRLAFDAFVPSVSLLAAKPDARRVVGRFGPNDETTIEETTRYDPIAQISHIDWYWSRPGEPDFWHCAFDMRQVFPQELPALLDANRIRLIERFGNYDRGPLVAGSRRQVCVCEPA